MTKEILQLQQRLESHYENYIRLKSEDIYIALKKNKLIPTRDQLDYLLCQALCSIPQQPATTSLDSEWHLLITLGKLFNTSNSIEPQFDMIALVIANRDLLNISNNWQHSVITLFELIIQKNLACIHDDLSNLKKVKYNAQQRQLPSAPNMLFRSKSPAKVKSDETEQCCNWITRDFTAMFF